MTAKASYIQKELFNLIEDIQSENELEEIKSLLISYLSERVVKEADESFDGKNYTADVFDKWKKEHFRKPA